MLRYVVRRLLLLVPILIGVSFEPFTAAVLGEEQRPGHQRRGKAEGEAPVGTGKETDPFGAAFAPDGHDADDARVQPAPGLRATLRRRES